MTIFKKLKLMCSLNYIKFESSQLFNISWSQYLLAHLAAKKYINYVLTLHLLPLQLSANSSAQINNVKNCMNIVDKWKQ